MSGSGDTIGGGRISGADPNRATESGFRALQSREGAQISTSAAQTATSSVLHVLQGLDKWKTDFVKDIRQEFENFLNSVDERMKSRSTTPSSRSFGSAARKPAASQSESESRKRLIPEVDEVTDLKLVAVKDDAWLPLMRMIMLYTVYSFSQAHKGAEAWLSEKEKQMMEDTKHLFADGISGFAMIFFSVANNDPKTRHRTSLGLVWSSLCTKVVVAMMMNARNTRFRLTAGGPDVPSWLRSFGGFSAATRYVSGVLEVLELTNQLPLVREHSKRVRREFNHAAAPDHALRAEREIAVKEIRSAVLRAMSDGRQAAKMHLYKELLFVVEKYVRLTPEERHSEGIEVMLGASMSEEETEVPDDFEGTIWQIDETRVDDDGYDANKEAMENLALHFPSLFVTLRYRKAILYGPFHGRRRGCTMESSPTDESASRPEYWNVEENFSLLATAAGLFLDTYRATDNDVVFKSSGQSLRAVFIFAIGLRGLIKVVLESTLSALEKEALGHIVFRVLKPDDECATVFLGSRSDPEQLKKCLKKEKDAKFSISYKDYIRAKRERESQERASSARSGAEHSGEIEGTMEARNDADFDMSWLGKGKTAPHVDDIGMY